jgi:site-specific DNA-methyltransferase (adenine-specific)
VRRAATRLTRDGSFFLNVGAKPTDPWTAFDVAQAARPFLRLQNTIHWIKSIAIERALAGSRAPLEEDLAVGHYKPINSRRFLHDCHEFVFHFTPLGATPLDRHAIGVRYQDQSNVGRWRAAASGVRCRGNTWFIPYETIQNRDKDRPHPATFPPRLPEMCLRLHGLDRISLVADPFLGLGSTAVACAQQGVSFVGIEMDRSYLTSAVERTKEALNGVRSLLPTTEPPRHRGTEAPRHRGTEAPRHRGTEAPRLDQFLYSAVATARYQRVGARSYRATSCRGSASCICAATIASSTSTRTASRFGGRTRAPSSRPRDSPADSGRIRTQPKNSACRRETRASC